MKNVIIFSLDTQQDAADSEQYSHALDITGGKLAMGCYKQSKEQSIIADISQLPIVLEIAKQFGQESILVIGQDSAYLQYIKDSSKTVIGTHMVRVSKEVATTKDAYTRYNNEWYIVE